VLGVVTAATALLLSGCVTPAPTSSAYESKAAMSADAAVSEVRTAVLAAKAYLRDGTTDAYLETVVGEAEESLGSVQATFDSVQPPEAGAADDLRATLDPLLADAGSGLTDLRIAVRRNQRSSLTRTAHDLSGVADELEAFGKEHGP
jgi:HPt (histidine-containing phosphotransfer) domain-containing protein